MFNLKEKFKDIYVDFGNGFKFIVDDIEINDFNNLILKVHPNSAKWIELEHDLDSKNRINMKGYDQFIAEQYEKEDEFWKELWEDLESDYWINEMK